MSISLPRRALSLSLSLALFLGLLIGVHYLYGWVELLSPWRTLSSLELISALALLIASYLFRAQRIAFYFRKEAPDRVRFLPTLRLVLLHNCLNNLLPTRTGEISFPILVRRYFGIELLLSLPALLWFRLMDLHTLLLIALLGLTLFAPLSPLMIGVGALSTLLWLLVPLASLLAHPLIARWSQSQPEKRFPALLFRLIEGLPHQRGHFFRLWGYTLINWMAKIIAFAWILHFFAGTSFLPSLFGAITGDMTSVLPIHGFAGAGSYELGVFAGLSPFGIERDIAIPAAVNLHLFILGGSFLGVIPALLIPVRQKDRH
jgi:uncharacterized membrane protein YbhN (UPF0104 family)